MLYGKSPAESIQGAAMRLRNPVNEAPDVGGLNKRSDESALEQLTMRARRNSERLGDIQLRVTEIAARLGGSIPPAVEPERAAKVDGPDCILRDLSLTLDVTGDHLASLEHVVAHLRALC